MDIVDRLRIEAKREPHEPIWRDAIAEIQRTRQAISLMSDAIQKTISENRHLADGDDCTLRHLVRSFESA